MIHNIKKVQNGQKQQTPVSVLWKRLDSEWSNTFNVTVASGVHIHSVGTLLGTPILSLKHLESLRNVLVFHTNIKFSAVLT